jgi:hypothetical protein
MKDLYKQASRLKLRFSTTKGDISVEDLWSLSLEALDAMAIAVNKKVKSLQDETSFLSARPATDEELVLRLEILKDVIADKIAERDARKEQTEKRARATMLKQLLAQKQAESLNSLSAEEIQKQLEELGATV